MEPEQQQGFLDYALSVDLFVGATPADIRQVFRRINSYTVPLNYQEQRHAKYQGAFKWFIVELTQRFAQFLVDIGAFKESQISRMADAQLFTEVTMGVLDGISTYSKPKIDKFYERFDDGFSYETTLLASFQDAILDLVKMASLHSTVMMKTRNLYPLLMALMHYRNRFTALNGIYDFGAKKKTLPVYVESNLSLLVEALSSEEPLKRFVKFVDASQEGTNTITKRTIRFDWCCRAIDSEKL